MRYQTIPAGLLVVDLQLAFHPPPLLVQAILQAVPKYRMVVATRFTNHQDSLFRFVMGYTRVDANQNHLVPELQPNWIIDKGGYGLPEAAIVRLRETGLSNWHLCGLQTDACVLACAFSLWDAGLRPWLLPQLCYSPSHANHKAGVQLFARQFGNDSVIDVPYT